MKKFFYTIILFSLAASIWVGCTKKESWTEGVETPKTSLGILVLNTKDQKPVSGIRTILERRISADGTYMSIDTGRTNAEGKYTYAVSYPNEFKVRIDTTFYTEGETIVEFENKEAQEVVLNAVPKFGMAPITITVIDSITKEPMKNFNLAVSYLPKAGTEFISTEGIEKTDENGQLIVSLPWPSDVKIEVPEGGFYSHAPVIAKLASDAGAEVELKIQTDVKVNITVVDASYKRRLPDASLKVSLKKDGESTFTELAVDPLDDEAFLSIGAVYPAEMKIEFAGDDWFEPKETLVTINNAIDKPVDFLLTIKPPKYPEPKLSNLFVGTLAFNNSLSVNKPQDIVTDKLGNVYITEGSGNRILRVDRNGNTTVLAGTGKAGSVDGPGAEAQLYGPWGITVDKEGNLYTVDNSNSAGSHKIRKISIDAFYNAEVSTIAGTGSSGGTNGIGTAASFNRPSGICYDEQRNCLYVAEWGGHRVRKISLANNEVTTIAGSGTSGVAGGIGVEANFQIPWGVELSADGESLYVASWNGNALHKINLATTNVEVMLTANNLGSPRGIYVSPSNTLFLAGTGAHQITYTNDPVVIKPVLKIAGNGSGNVDGPALSAKFAGPVGIHYDPYTGTWYIADGDGANNKVRTMRSSDLP